MGKSLIRKDRDGKRRVRVPAPGRLGLEGSPADELISELGRKLAYRDFEYQVGALTLFSLSKSLNSVFCSKGRGKKRVLSLLLRDSRKRVLPKTCSRTANAFF